MVGKAQEEKKRKNEENEIEERIEKEEGRGEGGGKEEGISTNIISPSVDRRGRARDEPKSSLESHSHPRLLCHPQTLPNGRATGSR